MKKVLFILWAAFFSLCSFAQNDFLNNLQINPEIHGLINYADSLGFLKGPRLKNNRKRVIEFSFHLGLFYDEDTIPDKSNLEMMAQNARAQLLLDSTRQTFANLADKASEIYMYEHHKDDIDSMNYMMALGHPNKRIDSLWVKEDFPDAPGYATFKYIPELRPNGSLLYKKGYGIFYYRQQLDSISHSYDGYIDTKAYWKILKKIFKRRGLKTRPIYMLCNDSALNYRDDMETGFTDSHHQFENRGISYKSSSEEEINDIIQEIIKATTSFIGDDTNIEYGIFPNTKFPNSIMESSVIFFRQYHKEDALKHFDVNIVQSFKNKDEYYIIIREGYGSLFLPRNWENLKSWINGKKVYYKKK